MMKAGDLRIREIGRRLKKDPSIISRELNRNSVPVFLAARLTPLEQAKEAQDKAKRRRREKRRGKRKARPLMSVFDHIAEKLGDKWSPEAISNTWEEHLSGPRVSTSTIYRMIKQDAPALIKLLPEGGKKRRARVMDRRGRFQQGAAAKRHKSERPAEADTRSEIGHLEGDSILSKRGSKGGLLSLIDRKARQRWYIDLVDLTADTVRKALVTFLHTLPPCACKTLTLDRGSEFAEWDMLERIFTGLKVYFCTPYSPYEKGSVERSNRDLRRYFPKGTDFSQVQEEQLAHANVSINNKPMKWLNWKSSAKFYQEELARVELELYQKVA